MAQPARSKADGHQQARSQGHHSWRRVRWRIKLKAGRIIESNMISDRCFDERPSHSRNVDQPSHCGGMR